MSNEQLMRRAIELSVEGMRAGHGGPFGAIVAADGVVLAEGFNRVLSSHDPTAHAEIVAIRAAANKLGRFSLKGCELFTSCEPCPMCLAAAFWARIDRIYFANGRWDAAEIGFDDSFFYDELALPIADRKIPMSQMMSDEAAVAFREWAAKRDKQPY